ncbi:hypothetical protein NKH52_20625 [Mesorhizobium sp. M1066]|uniref:hypothetical protein n=1 Tax=unclassified Mesorhizobium TaxID=325217 RepID=UPI0018CA1FA4|nr:hypothetical protein [Mesorhizobium sp. L2C084A000]
MASSSAQAKDCFTPKDGFFMPSMDRFIMLPLRPPCFTAVAGAMKLIRQGSHMIDELHGR